eukprot:438868-Amorphochlora_amoeboformis.AAC.1
MTEVEQEMKSSIKQITKEALYHYADSKRVDWIFKNLQSRTCEARRGNRVCTFTQGIVLSASQIWWTWEVENAFSQVQKGEKLAMKKLARKLTGQLTDLVDAIRGRLDSMQRKKMNTLIIIDVHA